MNDRVLDVLAQAAADRVRALVPSSAPLDRVAVAVHQDQSRRTAAAVVGAALSVFLILAVVFAAVPRLTADPVPPAVPQPTYPAVHGTVSVAGVDWPLAGELVTNQAFVAGAARQIDRQFRSEHPGSKEAATVIFAGDLGEWRVVVAQYAVGEPRLAYGPRGVDPTLLVATQGPPVFGDPGGPITVLLPNDGDGSHLLVVSPAGVSVEVASSRAVWPDQVPPYRPATLHDGVAVLPLDPAPPFAAWPNALAARGQSTSGPLAAWTLGIGVGVEDDVARLDSELVAPWAAVQTNAQSAVQTAVRTDAQAAGDTALRHGRFASDPTLTLRASAVLGSGLTAGVVDASTGGVCSRAMSVSTTGAGGSAQSSVTMEPALSLCDVVDPRPLVVQDVRISGKPLSVVWVALPHAQVSVQFGPLGSRNDLQADAHGFLLMPARAVQVLAVRAADGSPLWAAPTP